MTKINVLSLFDGISCGQVALNRAKIKYKKYYASEIDQNAINITQANYPETIQIGDVRKVNFLGFDKIDLLLAGSPCQGFSFIGKQLNFKDERSSLFFEFVRILKILKPKYFLLENVVMKKEYQQIISDYLGVDPILINSSLVSAQNRRRLYWTNIPNVTHPTDKKILFKIIVDDTAEFRPVLKCFYNNWGNASRLSRLKDVTSDKANCITTNRTHTLQYILNSDRTMNRNLTIEEAEQLQTLPIGYTDCGISDTQRYKAIGNSWTVDVIAHILKNIKN